MIENPLRLPPELTSSPVFDPAVLKNLIEMVGGDREIVNDIVNTWIEESPSLVAMLTGNTDADALYNASHTLKSSSRSVGAMRIGAIAEQIEASARGGEVHASVALCAAALTETTQALTDWQSSR